VEKSEMVILSFNDRLPTEQDFLEEQLWEEDKSSFLLLPIDAEPNEDHAMAQGIAINFPTFSDGRGLSLAFLLRNRLDFTGELRAVGDIIPDILHYLVRCGFDNAELKNDSVDRRGQNPVSQFDLLNPYTANYQASVVEPKPAYRRTKL
tara:strand:+ start:167 stop:613 length:447 start_codon:yes stop_codon:yes gene_type:complete